MTERPKQQTPRNVLLGEIFELFNHNLRSVLEWDFGVFEFTELNVDGFITWGWNGRGERLGRH